MNWISVNERLPEVNGPAVLGLLKIGKSYTVIGSVQFTTREGDIYKGTANEGEPVWFLWCPYHTEDGAQAIGPNDITHWMPLPEPPTESGE